MNLRSPYPEWAHQAWLGCLVIAPSVRSALSLPARPHLRHSVSWRR